MAYVIGDDCIACGTCIDECPRSILLILTFAQSVEHVQAFARMRQSVFLNKEKLKRKYEAVL
jgi:ferredoxin